MGSSNDDDDDEIQGLHTLVILATDASRADTMAQRPRKWLISTCLFEVYDVEQELLRQLIT
jgi:hypothetical protein